MGYEAQARSTAQIQHHWQGDKLSRAKLALDIERYIIDRSKRPASEEGALTIALDGDYGSGKSFFLRRLQKQLSDQFPVAFVDAWADDSGDDPLLSLILAIHEALASKLGSSTTSGESRQKVRSKAKALGAVAAKSILRGGLKLLITEKGVSEFEEVLKTGLDESFEAIADPAKANDQSLLLSRRSQIREFQKSLSELLHEIEANGGVSLPLVVLIDELDRCRPTYALKLLEESKHFFDNTETVFIYGINVGQLTHTVRAVYGTDYNASHYLARFLKVSLNLPVPDNQDFVVALMDADSAAVSDWKIVSGPIPSTKEVISKWLSDLFTQSTLTARDIERVMDNLFIATRVRDDSFPVQLAALAPLAVIQYLRRIGRDPHGTANFMTPQILGADGSETLFSDIMRRTTGAATLERQGSNPFHISWIRSYAQEYVEFVRPQNVPIDLGEIKLPHAVYDDLLQQIGPRTYGGELGPLEAA